MRPRILEAKPGQRTHGRIKKRALFTIRWSRSCRCRGVHPMKRSRGAVAQALAPKPNSATSRSWVVTK